MRLQFERVIHALGSWEEALKAADESDTLKDWKLSATANIVDATGQSHSYQKATNTSADTRIEWAQERRDEWRKAIGERQAAAVKHDSSEDYFKRLWEGRRKVVKGDKWNISPLEIAEIKKSVKGIELPELIKDLHHTYRQICLKCMGFHERMTTFQGQIIPAIARKCENQFKSNTAKCPPSEARTNVALRETDISVNMGN
jgi:hypothetical protein